jgi:protease I
MLEGKRIAILVEDGFEDSELLEPMRAMKDFGAKVTVIGSGSSRNYLSKKGTCNLTVDISIDNVNADDFDVVIIPGGDSPDNMRLNQSILDFIRHVFTERKTIAAICHGPQLLISADILKGRRVTSKPSIAIDIKHAGARWIDMPVVVDGNLITSQSPADIPRFNEAIVHALIETNKRRK